MKKEGEIMKRRINKKNLYILVITILLAFSIACNVAQGVNHAVAIENQNKTIETLKESNTKLAEDKEQVLHDNEVLTVQVNDLIVRNAELQNE